MNLKQLNVLELKNNILTSLTKDYFTLSKCDTFNVSYNQIKKKICEEGCSDLLRKSLIVDLRGNALSLVSKKSFISLSVSLYLVSTFGICCFFDNPSKCISEEPSSAIWHVNEFRHIFFVFQNGLLQAGCNKCQYRLILFSVLKEKTISSNCSFISSINLRSNHGRHNDNIRDKWCVLLGIFILFRDVGKKC